ncbi:MAG: substrate-binding domain-containing protein [Moraxella sp.]
MELFKKGLVAHWQSQFPNKAVPYTSAIVFLVRKDNPKQIKDWSDLAKPGVQIVLANPKTTGNGRYAFLGAYGYGLHSFNKDESKTKNFVKELLKNVPVYENGVACGDYHCSLRYQIGDVLVTLKMKPISRSNSLVKAMCKLSIQATPYQQKTPWRLSNQ